MGLTESECLASTVLSGAPSRLGTDAYLALV